MIQPDLLVCWIRHVDYPIFRRFLKRHRDFFGKIIIYWSEHYRDMYLDKFMEESLKDLNVQFLQPIAYKHAIEDWRHIATTYMLKYSVADWFCSVEGDFFTTDWKKLYEATTEASRTYDVLGYKGTDYQQEHQQYLKGDYVHPAFFFINKKIFEKTSKNFAAKPDQGADHYGLITKDLMKMNIPIWWTQDNGFPEETTWHQGGINYNYLEGLKEGFVFHRPELFYIYNYWSMKADVPQNPDFMELMKKIDMKLKILYPNIDPLTDPRRIFYI